MVRNEFKVYESGKCVYHKSKNKIWSIICPCVDNLLTFDLNIHVVKDVISLLSNNFFLKNPRETNGILGIKTTRLQKIISFDQSHGVKRS